MAAQQITHNQVAKTSNSNNNIPSFIHDDVYFYYEYVICAEFGGDSLSLFDSGSVGGT